MQNDLQAIQLFLKQHKVATLCGVDDGMPFCFNCFYKFVESKMLLVFKSAAGSRQARIFGEGTPVVGTILGDHLALHHNEGLRLEGGITTSPEICDGAHKTYHLQYPAAVLMKGFLFVVELRSIQLTKTIAGCRDKQCWNRIL